MEKDVVFILQGRHSANESTERAEKALDMIPPIFQTMYAYYKTLCRNPSLYMPVRTKHHLRLLFTTSTTGP